MRLSVLRGLISFFVCLISYKITHKKLLVFVCKKLNHHCHQKPCFLVAFAVVKRNPLRVSYLNIAAIAYPLWYAVAMVSGRK